MIGAIIGDIVGSYWEFREEKVGKDEIIDLFRTESTITDDSILTVATAEAIIFKAFYSSSYQRYCRSFPTYGYGPSFMEWAHTNSGYLKESYSWGNGAAMRVSPIGWAFDSPQRVMQEAQQSACVTHCHPEGLKGSQATAMAVYMARTGSTKAEIREFMQDWFEYDLDLNLDTLHEEYVFDVSCQGTVPVALACVLQADSFEQTLRNGLYVGGDSDTLLAIAGAIAEPLYGVPEDLRKQAETIVHAHSPALLGMIHEFEKKYGKGKTAASNPDSIIDVLLKLIRRK